MSWSIPTPIPYQGSKRRLARQVLAHAPQNINGALIEPFAGSAAVSLAASAAGRAEQFVLADILEPLAKIWNMILEEPEALADAYEYLWLSQQDEPRSAYNIIRAEFNKTRDPARLLYLIVRCVKNSVRFNPSGEFNQSPDNRRRGMHPTKMRREIRAANQLLSGKTMVLAADYREPLSAATSEDLVYMDPPYQGVSTKKDRRYVMALDLDSFVAELDRLNTKSVPYMVSFDGKCGNRTYGQDLPSDLGLVKLSLPTGRSTQATLLGRHENTVESLYISPALQKYSPTGYQVDAGDQLSLLQMS